MAHGEQGLHEERERVAGLLGLSARPESDLLCSLREPFHLSGMEAESRLTLSALLPRLASRACGRMRDVDLGEPALEDPLPFLLRL